MQKQLVKTDATCLRERYEHFIGRCGETNALIVICSQKQKKKRKKEIVFLYCFHSIFIKQFTTRKCQYVGSDIVGVLTPNVTVSLFFSLKVFIQQALRTLRGSNVLTSLSTNSPFQALTKHRACWWALQMWLMTGVSARKQWRERANYESLSWTVPLPTTLTRSFIHSH